MRRRALAPRGLAAPVTLASLATLAAIAAIPGCYIDDPLIFVTEADAGADGSGGATGGAGTGGRGGAAPDAPPCVGDLECDDHNPCTSDVCSPTGCVHTPVPQGQVCGATDPCEAAERCDGAGACVKGSAPVIDDGDACTTDACDPLTGVITHTPVAACAVATSTTGAPSPRKQHRAVWTGARMLVWGGAIATSPFVTATGGLFDPTTNTWTATSTTGAPPPRHSHCAVWTGSKLIVWGGFGANSFETTGGLYDPANDTWSSMTTTGAPVGRVQGACVWTGSELVVWGGTNLGGVIGSGGRYDPATDTWKALPSSGAPSGRYAHSGVWTGTRAIVWGGNDLFNWHSDGKAYDPAADAWVGGTLSAGAPSAREQQSALWTGSRMVVWGGFTGGVYEDTGGSLDPASEAWTKLTTAGAPSPRAEHTATWTGSKMIVWGGCGSDSCATLLGDGGVWTPDAGGGAWTAIAASPNAAPRRGATAVWTGSAVVIWGGRVANNKETDTGAILHP